jgi:oxysterol-binding protein-related protein 3/6/7
VPENSKQYYGFTRFTIELNELDDELRQILPPTDTRFRPDQRFVSHNWPCIFVIMPLLCSSLLEAGQVDLAEKEKARIEQAQRSRSATGLCPKWFKEEGESFVLIQQDEALPFYWKKREDHWQNVEFLQLW